MSTGICGLLSQRSTHKPTCILNKYVHMHICCTDCTNFKGIGLVTALIEEYALKVVQAYMHQIHVQCFLLVMTAPFTRALA